MLSAMVAAIHTLATPQAVSDIRLMVTWRYERRFGAFAASFATLFRYVVYAIDTAVITRC